ncbi:sulfotransferase [Puniceicoccaceae bacterium K14]|nr:sulfotransferase [Puniceicoccaceae bacterium K14]
MLEDRKENAVFQNAKLPYALININGKLIVHWVDAVALDFRYGFFRDSIEALPLNKRVCAITPIEDLFSLPASQEPAEEKAIGLIYHCSRCGSTLLCQMLKCHPDFIVIGELGIFSSILKSRSLPSEQKMNALRKVAAAFQDWAAASGKRVIFKLTSWQIEYWEILSEAFDTASAVLLFREPIAVIESLLRKPPNWLLNEIQMEGNRESALCEEAVRIYSHNAQKALEFKSVRPAMLIDYENMDNSLEQILEQFEAKGSEGILKKMKSQKQFYAKSSAKDPVPISMKEKKPNLIDRCGYEPQMILESAQLAYARLL